jgi:D-3-phosphoglycerate dehydrogenase
MFNGRETLGGEAMTVYNLDEPVPEDVAAEIRADERIIEVKGITLGDGEDEEETAEADTGTADD